MLEAESLKGELADGIEVSVADGSVGKIGTRGTLGED
jgi:hypothetical protein